MEGMFKEEKERKRKSNMGSSTIEGTTKERASVLHKEKCAG